MLTGLAMLFVPSHTCCKSSSIVPEPSFSRDLNISGQGGRDVVEAAQIGPHRPKRYWGWQHLLKSISSLMRQPTKLSKSMAYWASAWRLTMVCSTALLTWKPGGERVWNTTGSLLHVLRPDSWWKVYTNETSLSSSVSLALAVCTTCSKYNIKKYHLALS